MPQDSGRNHRSTATPYDGIFGLLLRTSVWKAHGPISGLLAQILRPNLETCDERPALPRDFRLVAEDLVVGERARETLHLFRA